MSDKKPLTISCIMFEFPKGTTLSDVIKELQREDDVHFDDKLVPAALSEIMFEVMLYCLLKGY